MSNSKNLSPGRIDVALFEFLATGLLEFELTVLPGVRNTKDNPETVIFCNTPVRVQDQGALGDTVARIEIINKKQDSGVEQLLSTRDGDDNITRWGTIDLQDAVLDALFPEGVENRDLGSYTFNLKDVRKQQDKDYIYIMVLLNCIISK